MPALSKAVSACCRCDRRLVLDDHHANSKSATQEGDREVWHELAIEAGQLTAIIVKGSGKANLEITLERSDRIKLSHEPAREPDTTMHSQVRPFRSNGGWGPSFFVASEQILTCAHVVKDLKG